MRSMPRRLIGALLVLWPLLSSAEETPLPPFKLPPGFVLEVVYNAFEHVSELQIYRAQDLSDCICVAKLKHHVPHQFHGCFTPEVFGTSTRIDG